MHALSLTAGQQSVTIRSNSHAVTDWATTYFGAFWKTAPTPDTTVGHRPMVTAIDDDRHAPATIRHTHHAVFAREPIGYTRHPDNTVTAHTLTSPVIALRYTPDVQHLQISSHKALQTTAARPGQPTRLATATTRFAREMMRARLIQDGWVLLHASAAVLPGGRTVLALGDSGAGKTTTALTLASSGATLLANDCCFARPNTTGSLDLLPWPAAATVGLGLLHALHLADSARRHLQAGEPPHPTQDQRVTDALTTGHTSALVSTSGRELKAHIWPEQLTRWFGLPLALTGIAAGVLLPRIISSTSITARVNDARSTQITASVFVTSNKERYPDLFNLTNGHNTGTPTARDQVLRLLNRLPRQAVDLSHDHAANTRLLTNLTTSLAIDHPGKQ